MKKENSKILFSSESVGRGHPDKVCDQISDAILDAYLNLDPQSKVAIETMASGHNIIIAGEVKSKANVDVLEIARNILKELGYYTTETNFITDIRRQSDDIAMGVELSDGQIGAGDQGIMFGFATDETPEYMPLAITLANELVKLAEKLRISKEFKWAKADMKSQVTVDYTNEKTKIDTVLMSIQHSASYNEEEFKTFIKNDIIKPVLSKYGFEMPERILINPTGQFVLGGPLCDTGLTGRKIIVDTYGGYARHGGGAFSGKDATKVDRSAAYAARWIAKNLVAAGVAKKVEVQIAYAIGVAEPVSINVETFATHLDKIGGISGSDLVDIIKVIFDLTPKGIINDLGLTKPIFQQTAFFGHFGRNDLDLPWEKLNKVDAIKDLVYQVNKWCSDKKQSMPIEIIEEIYTTNHKNATKK
ncbi:methionine adenosyltransferase [Mycoplasma sp. Pen4]|uniref:methionine adenosyltransferase n=1 Tax=Mycoplasma sp. Pen4 TaxID=640330 RepID=UPI0016543284|nr:methionine adenosyltransferase [Mycoplasma sp. Pen4]QNM93912.1 methionine adenosyltransferase [Mycoplasma sp. Pen4]